MRVNIVKTSSKDLRQGYMQQYLKLLLRRVHPDLFQSYPKEQLRNSISLQDLLPLINHEKGVQMESRPFRSSSDTESRPTKLVFYLKPKTTIDNSRETPSSRTELESAEHLLPDPNTTISSNEDTIRPSTMALKREIRSWQMVQSFLKLCRKVGVSVKDSDQQDVAQQLEQSIRAASTQDRSNHLQVSQKPLSEVFEGELKDSFSESELGTRGEMHLGKTGAAPPLSLDAQVMIKTNSLLFKSPELSSSRLSKVIRTWIYWQEEDRRLVGSSIKSDTQIVPFSLSDWWRKVPVIVLSSTQERAEMLRLASTATDDHRGPGRGILVVDQVMSKQEMTWYLRDNLERVQGEYKEILRTASVQPSSRLAPQPQPQQTMTSQQEEKPLTLSPEAASYLERMKAKAQLQDTRLGPVK
ncbi:hypothetical protein BGZ65_001619 [Modicella reniformis]|uniref:DUF4460 domain-containing protein n=1 Tax=Modicella reniformis TaxID=1440133 RepID=A0A9P6M9Y7_9FUNG|nr:hypothetical protein BGZ65_001619 [Modicella reniformis]